MMARGARILLGRNVLDGSFEAFETFFEFAFAVDGGKGYAQEVLLTRFPDGESAGMQDSDAVIAEEFLRFRSGKR